jgi:lipoprotein NlpI
MNQNRTGLAVFAGSLLVAAVTAACLNADDPPAADNPAADNLAADKSAAVNPLTEAEQQALNADLDTRLTEAKRSLLDAHSRMGDAQFFRGDFAGAFESYQRMVELDPGTDAGHWRKGIAAYYAGRYADGAAQFSQYHRFDNVDRENGIWKFLCEAKETDVATARKQLLKYDKADRPPLGEVYRLFTGEVEPRQLEDEFRDRAAAKSPAEQLPFFYVDLYLGLYADAENRKDDALRYLASAVKNPGPQAAGYGPRYMWHVARVHFDLLARK